MAQTLLQYAAEMGDPIAAGVAMAVTNAGVFMRRLRFITAGGMSFTYPELQKLGGIYYRELNEDYPRGDYSIVNPVSERMPIFGGEVRTDNQFLSVNGGVMRTHEIQRRAKKAALFYDREVLHGDPSKVSGKGMTGLRQRIGGKQLLSAGTNGGPLTLDLLDELIDAVHGPNSEKILLMNKAARRSLKKVLVGSAGGSAVGDFGPSLPSYDGVVVETIDEDGDESPILDFDEPQGTDPATTSVYCVRPGGEPDFDGLQGLIGVGPGAGQSADGSPSLVRLIECGHQGTYWLDILEVRAGLAVFNARSAARIKGIKKPA